MPLNLVKFYAIEDPIKFRTVGHMINCVELHLLTVVQSYNNKNYQILT